jgi:hypothetical protein
MVFPDFCTDIPLRPEPTAYRLKIAIEPDMEAWLDQDHPPFDYHIINLYYNSILLSFAVGLTKKPLTFGKFLGNIFF